MGLSLCTVGYLAVSLVSTHRMLGSPPVAWRGDLEAVHWVWPPGVGRTGLGGLGSCWVPGTKALKENRWEGPRVEGFGMNPRALLPVLTPPRFPLPQPLAATNKGILSAFPSSPKCPHSPSQFALRERTFPCPLEGCFPTKKPSEREENQGCQ